MDWDPFECKASGVCRVDATLDLDTCLMPQEVFAEPTRFARKLRELIRGANAVEPDQPAFQRKVCLTAKVEMMNAIQPDETSIHHVNPGYCMLRVDQHTPVEQLKDEVVEPFIEHMIQKIEDWNELGSGWVARRVVRVCIHLAGVSSPGEFDSDNDWTDTDSEDDWAWVDEHYGSPGFVLTEHLNDIDMNKETGEPTRRLGFVDIPAPNGECFHNAVTLAMLRDVCANQPEFNKKYKTKKWRSQAAQGLNWHGIPEGYVARKDIHHFTKINPHICILFYTYDKRKPPRRNLQYLGKHGSTQTAAHTLHIVSFTTHTDKHLIHISADTAGTLLHAPTTAPKHMCPHCSTLICHKATKRKGVTVPWAVRKHEHVLVCPGLVKGKPRLKPPDDGRLKFDLKLCGDVHERVTADIECVTHKASTAARETPKNEIAAHQEPVMIGAVHTLLGVVQDYQVFEGDDCIEQFLEWLSGIEKAFVERRKARTTDVARCRARMTSEQRRAFEAATICVICRSPITGKKVLHHCPFSVQPYGATGAACHACNSGVHTADFLPILFYNLNYDFTFIMQKMMAVRQKLFRDKRRISAVPKGTPGKFIEFEIVKKKEDKVMRVEQFLQMAGEPIRWRQTPAHPFYNLTEADVWSGGHELPNGMRLKEAMLSQAHFNKGKQDKKKTKFPWLYWKQQAVVDPGVLKNKIKVAVDIGTALRFLDAAAYTPPGQSLDKIVQSMLPVKRASYPTQQNFESALLKRLDTVRERLPATSRLYPDPTQLLDCCFKGSFPFDWFDDVAKLEASELPAYGPDWYSKLSKKVEDIAKYVRSVEMAKKYCGWGTPGLVRRYLKFYLKIDCYITEDFLNMLVRLYWGKIGTHPLRCLTGAQLAWNCMLLKCAQAGKTIYAIDSGITPADAADLATVPTPNAAAREMVTELYEDLTGGMTNKFVSGVDVNRPMCPGYDPTKPQCEIIYHDVKSMYVSEMLHKLPSGGYTYITGAEAKHQLYQLYGLWKQAEKAEPTLQLGDFCDRFDTCYIIRFDGAYMCKACHEAKGRLAPDLHCKQCQAIMDVPGNMPCFPLNREVSDDERSPVDTKQFADAGLKTPKGPKLISDFHPRVKHLAMMRNMLQALDQGYTLTKFHKSIRCSQDFVMKPWMDFTVGMRAAAKLQGDDFMSTLMKFSGNVAFGKSCQSPYKTDTHVRVHHSGQTKEIKKARSDARFTREDDIAPGLLMQQLMRKELPANRPAAIGFAITQHSKALMMQYNQRYTAAGFLNAYGDTDSGVYYKQWDDPNTNPVIDFMIENRHWIDLAAFPEGHTLKEHALPPLPVGSMEEEKPIATGYMSSNQKSTGLIEGVIRNNTRRTNVGGAVGAVTISHDAAMAHLNQRSSTITSFVGHAAKCYVIEEEHGENTAKSKGVPKSVTSKLTADDYRKAPRVAESHHIFHTSKDGERLATIQKRYKPTHRTADDKNYGLSDRQHRKSKFGNVINPSVPYGHYLTEA